MSASSIEPLDSARLPEFGEHVLQRATPCTPRELFCCLFVDPEEHVHYFLPAFHFASAALAGVDAPPVDGEPAVFLERLIGACAAGLARAHEADGAPDGLASSASAARATASSPHASSWPVRVARELAPLGLADGVWLRGFAQANAIENEVGMRALRQLMIRLGDPGSREGYAQRFAALLTSLGVPPDSITRWEWDESAPCADISYEHALLGLCIGFFPSRFSLETLGFNLWMTAIGPCPLLERLAPALRQRGANLRYLDQHDRSALGELGRRGVLDALAEHDTPERRQRIGRGVVAARESYRRWEQAMLGRNVPITPRDFVLEGIRRKARFAIEHHRDVRLAKSNVAELLAEGGASHELLLDKLAASALVRRGAPDQSRFLSHSISIDGPMFDAFTAAEKVDLREWITDLGRPAQPASARPAPVPLAGHYGPPQDPESLEQFAFERYSGLSNADLYYSFANSDCHPAILLFARAFVDEVFGKLNEALDTDSRLNSMTTPPYSERAIAEMVAEQYQKNVRSRAAAASVSGHEDGPDTADEIVEEPRITQVFDGSWLQGFADVRRASFEEYGWLFRIYASEHGDGDLAWNHCQIFRRAFAEAGPDVMLPKTERRFYDLFEIGNASLATLAVAMNTCHFLPEILGLNLAIEATGVGGMYLDQWKHAEKHGAHWKALAHRLHNSIDNHADGHTKWSLAAVQAFMRRVKTVAPSDLDAQWRRIWRPWRCQDILTHGTESERAALAELLDVSSLAPT
jgi:hypothetical protein